MEDRRVKSIIKCRLKYTIWVESRSTAYRAIYNYTSKALNQICHVQLELTTRLYRQADGK